MAENYCGKSCGQCQYRETMNCPGCKVGPGRLYGGDCELAKCAREKGHQICSTCTQHGNCGYYRDCHHFPEYRRRRQNAQLQKQEALSQRVPFLGKWLWLLFWLIIPTSIASLISNDTFGRLYPELYFFGKILSILCAVAYGLILLKLGQEEEEYRSAGGYTLFSGACSLILGLIPATLEYIWLSLILTVPAIIVELIAESHEYSAHSTALAELDRELSEKWLVLKKWFIGTYLGVFGGLILMMMFAGLGSLIMLASSIGLLVVSIIKLIYLYRTARLFRNYSVS